VSGDRYLFFLILIRQEIADQDMIKNIRFSHNPAARCGTLFLFTKNLLVKPDLLPVNAAPGLRQLCV